MFPLYVDVPVGTPSVPSAAQGDPSIFALRIPEPIWSGGGLGTEGWVGKLSCVHPFITLPAMNTTAIAV
jgi:hypothetical protein